MVIQVFEDELLEPVIKLRNGLIFTVLVSILILLAITFLFANSIAKALKQCVDFSSRIAEGDLTSKLSIDQNDEIGRLTQALNKMQTKLREVVSQIRMGADEISGASNQVSAGAQQMTKGASEQASVSETVSTALIDLSESINESTSKALTAENKTKNAQIFVEQVNQSGKGSVEAINNIATRVGIIGEIANQTNMLS